MARCVDVAAGVALAAFTLCASIPSHAARDSGEAGGRITAAVDTGFDSFQERYAIVDEDTLDSITEFRSRLALGYRLGSPFGDYLHVQGTTLLGDEIVEYAGRLDWIRRFGERSSRVAVFADVTRRNFLDESSYDFANDHTRYYLKSYARWNIAEAFALRLSDRVQHVSFRDRTEFDYDHTQNSLEFHSEFDWNLSNYLIAGVRYTTMSIPDSSQIEYQSWAPELEFRTTPGLYKLVSLRTSVERRHYAYEPVRSSYWAVLASASFEWPLSETFSVAVHDETESYSYDNGTGIYFDYTETRNAALLKYNYSWSLRVGAGPTYSTMVGRASPDDEYREYGGKLTVDYLGGTAVWLSAGFEPGRRHYKTFDESSDVPSVYSDYTFKRFNGLVSIRVWDGVSLSALVDYQPEDHEREGDDATATLVSVSLTYVY